MRWLAILLIFFSSHFAIAKPATTSNPPRREKALICDDAKTQRVAVALGRLTILSFAVTPKEILPGENSFDFRQIKNDLAIKALRLGARTNVFVYMSERRCAFDLVTVSSGGDDIIFIRDPKDRQMEVNYK